MAIELQDLTSLDPNAVQQNLLAVIAQLQEAHPTLDLRRGPVHDLLAYFHAVLATAEQVNVTRYQSARSLAAIQADPTLADPDIVDDVLSNYRVTRTAGAAATGSCTIVLSADLTVTIAQGAVFVANGQNYVTPSVFTAKTESAQVRTSTDRLITPLNDGSFAFTIDLVAQNTGSAALLPKDSLMTPLAPPANFVTAYATSDFTGGTDTETNADLLNRLLEGIATKAFSNRITMTAMLLEMFSQIVSQSICGYGSPEMIRDQHSIFPVSMGGRVDWYARTSALVVRQALTKTATLIATTSDGFGIWQFALGRDDAPGFYEIANIRLPSAAPTVDGYPLQSDMRALDLTGGGFIPDVVNIVEGAYSRFQTAIIQFKDTITPTGTLEIGATQSYTLEARGMPLIGAIQDALSAYDIRSYGADCLVRAPIPCFVKLNFTINQRPDATDPDLTAIATALAAAVNAVGFIGRLDASILQDTVQAFLTSEATVSLIDMLGRLRYPDGSLRYLRSPESLIVPAQPALGISPNTVQFFLDPEDVAIRLATTIPIPV